MRIYLYFVGKPRDPHLNAVAADFLARVEHFARTEMREIQPARADFWTKHPTAVKVLLDPAGRPLDTARFVDLVRRCEMESRDAVFVVGGHDGLPQEWKPRADVLLSLSPMTFPHEMARAMLAEQIYRAFTTLRGHPYPR
jgi:23S rRNA (pseudouridine1915-N3)-methyltransferase